MSRHIVVDMTPLDPGGQNGGAGLVATSLVRQLSALDSRSRFTLLTVDVTHADLAVLDRDNVERRCVVTRRTSVSPATRLVDRLLTPSARVRLKTAYRTLRSSPQVSQLTDELHPDVLFCPFTLPTFWRPDVPCVSIVYDLQHLTYPDFFTVEQWLNRQRQIEDAVARSDFVVSISKYVRNTLISRTGVRPERAVTIPLGLFHESVAPDDSVVERLGLKPGEFLLYPANFWPHKNHRRLFEALRIYAETHPSASLQLVCTGAPNELMRRLRAEVPDELVVFAGYVHEAELAALYEACAALIFPSLYEGFGMPVLEAMAGGKPVLCSNVTSMPEVAGDAAVYFDPTGPHQIAAAISSLADTRRVSDLVARGRGRAAQFGNARDVAARYLELMRSL